ncbi:DUF2474 family protein [Profundibacter sp.]|uniref:DUF2474 family protein n=1 Tax=Profundibacter sp. TaxID=3101071 RepID=UPI003D131B71
MAGKRSLSPSPTQPLTKPPDRRITQPARRCLKSISTTFETQPQHSLIRRLLWFAGLWIASVTALTIVAFAIRLAIGTG